MPDDQKAKAMTKAMAIAALMKIAPNGTHVDFRAENITELWETGASEDLLFELDQEGALIFEGVGDYDLLCYTTAASADHLMSYLKQAREEQDHTLTNVQDELIQTKATLAEIYQHNPDELRKKIQSSREHIENARITIKQDRLLAPLGEHLNEIQRHFDSLAVVAQDYSAVYSNILKPVEEEGKKGVRATVRWAVIGIIASVVLSNFAAIKALFSGAAG